MITFAIAVCVLVAWGLGFVCGAAWVYYHAFVAKQFPKCTQCGTSAPGLRPYINGKPFCFDCYSRKLSQR